MMTERQRYQTKMHCLIIEDLVPEDHLLRNVEGIVKWDFIYETVRELYSETVGRPNINPVMLVKYLLVGFLFGHKPLELKIAQAGKEVHPSTCVPVFQTYKQVEYSAGKTCARGF